MKSVKIPSHITSHSLSETETFAGSFLDAISHGDDRMRSQGVRATVVGLYGDLGSGKTAFTQAVARALNIRETVTSPTFVIEKIYAVNHSGTDSQITPFTHLIHIDAYRLEKSEELIRLGWNEIIADPANLILIEWPEKVPDIMPADHIKLSFTFIDEITREIERRE